MIVVLKDIVSIRSASQNLGTGCDMLIRRIDSTVADPSTATSRSLSIWAVIEGRVGDDKQVLALASALRGSVRIVQLGDTIPQVIAGRGLDAIGIDAPWHKGKYSDSEFPDLMIAAGGRSVTLARWIKRASHGRTKVVFLGRPWARLGDFDLVVTTPQYALPRVGNVQMNLLPLNHVDASRLEEMGAHWAPKFAHLPQPWIGALVGGNSGSFRMTPYCAKRLGARLSRLAQETGGSVLLTTSARTPAACAELVASSLTCPSYAHLWKPGQADNPYLGIIALADRFVVTGETASMIAEAANTGKTIELFGLQERPLSRLLTKFVPALGLGWVFRLGARNGYWTPPRHMERLHRALQVRGYLGDADSPARGRLRRPIEWDLARTVARISQLYAPEPVVAAQPTTPSGPLANQVA
jgi:uncharacterized protein